MSSRKIYLMSPREPSGATWLINCFLELGIKTYRDSNPSMWNCEGEDCVLARHEEILKKWLPALWDHPKFHFRNDVEVEWSHVWPTASHRDYQIIFFARDPRDSLFSRYKRESPLQSFEEFIRFPDVNTLLDKAHNWRLFNLAWMGHPNHRVFRFEDYKRDGALVLADILTFMGLEFSPEAQRVALEASTFQRAAEAEIKYRAEHPEDKELINRAGKAGEWMQGEITSEVVSYIETVCADVMRLQGYSCQSERKEVSADYSKLLSSLPFLQRVSLPNSEAQSVGGENLAHLPLKLVHSIDYDQIQRAGLRDYEAISLLESLTILAKSNNVSPLPDYSDIYRKIRPKIGLIRKVRHFVSRLIRSASLCQEILRKWSQRSRLGI